MHIPSVKDQVSEQEWQLRVDLAACYRLAAAYGWSDLDLGHGFHATKQGERFTISESARRTVLDRLLALNHERYAEEVKAGLHDKKGKKGAVASKRPRRTAAADTGSMFEDNVSPQQE